MEYDEMLATIGEFGRYQKLFVCLFSVSAMFDGLTTMPTNFIFGEHQHRCKLPGVDDDQYSPPDSIWVNITDRMSAYNVTECTIEINGTISECNTWVYDQSVFTATIISKFNIVCGKQFFRAHYLTAYYIGLLVGSIVSGVLCDTFGRKRSLIVGLFSLIVAEGLKPFMPNFTLVVILQFVNGFGSITTYISPFIIITELVGRKNRLLANFMMYMAYCLSFYVLLTIVYVFRDWTHVVWTVSIICGFYLIMSFFLIESPRWLLSRGRKEEAIVILRKMAEMNKKDCSVIAEDIEVKQEKQVPLWQFIKAMIKSRTLVIRLSIIGINWFAISMTYYGLAMNIGKLSGDVFVNFTISSSAETLAIILCLVLTDRIGHKRFYSIVIIIAGVACISTILTSLFDVSWLTTVLAMVGRFFISAAFFLVYLYTAELFPTVVRASAVGLASMFGRIGSISSAYIGEIGTLFQTKFGTALPILIFGALGLTAGLLMLLLPDTTNVYLPESVEDAKLLKRNKLVFGPGPKYWTTRMMNTPLIVK